MGLLGGLFKKKKKEAQDESVDASRYDWNNVYDVCTALGCLACCAREILVTSCHARCR